MEPNDLTQAETSSPQLTPESINHLLVAAKWGKFLAILGFIVIIFMVLAGLLISLAFSIMGDKMASLGGNYSLLSSGIMSAIYIILGVIMAVPVYFLNSFSNQVSKSVRNNDTRAMTLALKRLKNLFVFTGVYTILMIAIYIIAVIAIASAALLAG